MLTYHEGDLFQSGATALVNAVNCVGVMGAGLAKAFADRYPEMHQDYRIACSNKLLRPGEIHSYFNTVLDGPIIFNFPTKDDWRNPSELNYVEEGMQRLTTIANTSKIHSIAVPALGCGLGGLEWEDVRDIIEYWVQYADHTHWMLYGPQ